MLYIATPQMIHIGAPRFIADMKEEIKEIFCREDAEYINAYWNIWKSHNELAKIIFTLDQQCQMLLCAKLSNADERKCFFKYLETNICPDHSISYSIFFEENLDHVSIERKRLLQNKIKSLFINHPKFIMDFFNLCPKTVEVMCLRNLLPVWTTDIPDLHNFFSKENSHQSIQSIVRKQNIKPEAMAYLMPFMEKELGSEFYKWKNKLYQKINDTIFLIKGKLTHIASLTDKDWEMINGVLAMREIFKNLYLDLPIIIQLLEINRLTCLAYKRLLEDIRAKNIFFKYYDALDSFEEKMAFISKSPWFFSEIIKTSLTNLLLERSFEHSNYKNVTLDFWSQFNKNQWDVPLMEDTELINTILQSSTSDELRFFSSKRSHEIIREIINKGYLPKIFPFKNFTYDDSANRFIDFVMAPSNKFNELTKNYVIDFFRPRISTDLLYKLATAYSDCFDQFYSETEKFQYMWLIGEKGNPFNIEKTENIAELMRKIEASFEKELSKGLFKVAIYFATHDQIDNRLNHFLNQKIKHTTVRSHIRSYFCYKIKKIIDENRDLSMNNDSDFKHDFEQCLKNKVLRNLLEISGNNYMVFVINMQTMNPICHKILGTDLFIWESMIKAIEKLPAEHERMNKEKTLIVLREISPYFYVNANMGLSKGDILKKTKYIASLMLKTFNQQKIILEKPYFILETEKFHATFKQEQLNHLIIADKMLRDKLIFLFLKTYHAANNAERKDTTLNETAERTFYNLIRYSAIIPFLLYENSNKNFLTESQLQLLTSEKTITTTVSSKQSSSTQTTLIDNITEENHLPPTSLPPPPPPPPPAGVVFDENTFKQRAQRLKLLTLFSNNIRKRDEFIENYFGYSVIVRHENPSKATRIKNLHLFDTLVAPTLITLIDQLRLKKTLSLAEAWQFFSKKIDFNAIPSLKNISSFDEKKSNFYKKFESLFTFFSEKLDKNTKQMETNAAKNNLLAELKQTLLKKFSKSNTQINTMEKQLEQRRLEQQHKKEPLFLKQWKNKIPEQQIKSPAQQTMSEKSITSTAGLTLGPDPKTLPTKQTTITPPQPH